MLFLFVFLAIIAIFYPILTIALFAIYKMTGGKKSFHSWISHMKH